MERHFVGRQFALGVPPSALDGEQGRYVRWLKLPQSRPELTGEELGRAISGYIQMLDQVLKVYFANQQQPALAAEESQACYRSTLKVQPFVL